MADDDARPVDDDATPGTAPHDPMERERRSAPRSSWGPALGEAIAGGSTDYDAMARETDQQEPPGDSEAQSG